MYFFIYHVYFKIISKKVQKNCCKMTEFDLKRHQNVWNFYVFIHFESMIFNTILVLFYIMWNIFIKRLYVLKNQNYVIWFFLFLYIFNWIWFFSIFIIFCKLNKIKIIFYFLFLKKFFTKLINSIHSKQTFDFYWIKKYNFK